MRIQLSDHFSYKKLIKFTLPSIAMMIFTSIYGVVDGFFVSNFAGKTPFAAVNLIMPFLMIVATVGLMFGTGGTAIVAKTFGEGKRETANALFSLFVYTAFGLGVLFAVLGILFIPSFARLVRGNTLVLKQQTFIESARSIGASDMTVLLRHILPGTVSSIVVFFTMRIGTSIISAASLSFLGLGAQPPTPEWGAMLNEARADMVIAPHVAVFPALAIFLTVLAFNLLGDGLRDALDPKIKG